MTTSTQRPARRAGREDVPFWGFLEDQELRLQQCRDCGRFRYPPAPVCPDCWSEAHTWTPLSGRGVLLSWTRFHRQYFPELPAPYVVVAVQAVEGPILIGNLVGDERRPLAPGLLCRARFEPARDDAGEFWLCQWAIDPTENTTRTTEGTDNDTY